ncbi:hypothetical protein BBW65_06510 [Helicobacter enhydrae]|uniref:Mechanosensitive ion channel MscS domain-containing protein n=1 Tax=Helicobacter enhydrae TaxID=222136 RepID=A0A1B1U6S8_9HELI|nr:mechanosensitive ion channel domain-containing protein [Helicobacter enhydrae]ANV98469.1 hypothetical protein BBW65_06510 [Helicobacter enhydrae]
MEVALSYLLQYKSLLLSILKALMIGGLGIYLAFFIRTYICKWLSKQDPILGSFISQAFFVLFLILTGITTLGTLGVQTTSIVALLGTIGLTIALALKNSLSSLASGILLIVLRPFKQNDFVEIGSIAGHIESINLFQTSIRLENGKLAIFPNDKINNNTIINCSNLIKKREVQWLVNIASLQQNTQDLLLAIFIDPPLNLKPSDIAICAVGLDSNGMDFHIKVCAENPSQIPQIKDHFIHTAQTTLSEITSIKEIK